LVNVVARAKKAIEIETQRAYDADKGVVDVNIIGFGGRTQSLFPGNSMREGKVREDPLLF